MSESNSRAICYLRKSNKDSGQELQSLARQRRVCRELAIAHELEVIDELADVQSGLKSDRTAWQELLRRGAAGEFDVIITAADDRIGRTRYAKFAAQVEPLASRGIRWLHADGWERLPGDDDEDLGDELRGVVKSHARREESRKKSIHSTKEIAGRVANGEWTTRPPFGYRINAEYEFRGRRRVRVSGDGHLAIVEEEAAIVRQMFAWLIEGASAREICTRLNASGIKTRTGTNWQASTAIGIFKNRAYLGELHHGLESVGEFNPHKLTFVPNAHPAIINLRTWKRAERALQRNSRDSGGRGKHFYALRGKVCCGCCGGNMTGKPDGGHRYYICRAADRFGDCDMRAIVRADRLCEIVVDAVCSHFTGDSARGRLEREILRQLKPAAGTSTKSIQAALKKTTAALERAGRNLAYAQNAQQFELITTEIGKLEIRRAELEGLAAAHKPAGELKEQARQITRVAMEGFDKLRETLRQKDYRELRNLFNECIGSVTVFTESAGPGSPRVLKRVEILTSCAVSGDKVGSCSVLSQRIVVEGLALAV